MRCQAQLVQIEFVPYDVQFPIIVLGKTGWQSWLLNYITRKVITQRVPTRHLPAYQQDSRFYLDEKGFMCSVSQTKGQTWQSNNGSITTNHGQAPEATASLHKFVCGLCGPFVIIQGRGKRREKRYLCLFTCMATSDGSQLHFANRGSAAINQPMIDNNQFRTKWKTLISILKWTL